MNATNIKIEFVNTDEALVLLAQKLQQLTQFSFDTEFDRFWREYGFKLLLIQIYDGDTCYLLDPLSIKNFKPLWDVFEDKNICKIAYASSEDIQLLKINNCFTKNIFDVQIAAKLCNHPGNSFGDLVADICRTTIDKSLQRSNWRTRPLPMEQQVYASNDVIWLPQLKNYFDKIIVENNVIEIIATENKDCENIPVAAYEVKLSNKQHSRYSKYYKEVLLSLLILRDEVAAAYNMPPFMIFTDALMEEIVENPAPFLAKPFEKGFSSKFRFNEDYTNAFLNTIKNIDTSIPFEAVKKERPIQTEKDKTYYPSKDEIDNKCKSIHSIVTAEYGIIAGEFIVRGLKKALQAKPYKEVNLKNYQMEIINKACGELGIEL